MRYAQAIFYSNDQQLLGSYLFDASCKEELFTLKQRLLDGLSTGVTTAVVPCAPGTEIVPKTKRQGWRIKFGKKGKP